MISTFYVPVNKTELTKTLVRKYSTARFLQNPFDLFGQKTEFKIEIEVEEYNQLSKDLTENKCYCESENDNDYSKPENKFFNKLLRMFGFDK